MKKITGFISILKMVGDVNPRLIDEEMNLVTLESNNKKYKT